MDVLKYVKNFMEFSWMFEISDKYYGFSMDVILKTSMFSGLEGSAKFQTRQQAEDVDHAAYLSKQQRIMERKKTNYEKKIVVIDCPFKSLFL